jgi:cytoskeleton protein RodZ
VNETSGPGVDLRAAREGMGVSVREVADALNLPARVIESLEADDYDRLQPSVFTRGYLRSYARLLELNPDELLSRYPEVTEEVDVVPEEAARPSPVRDARVQLIGLAAVATVLVLVLLAWLLSGGEEESPAPVKSESTTEDVGTTDEGAVPSASVATPRTQTESPVPVSTVEPADREAPVSDRSGAAASEPVPAEPEAVQPPPSDAASETDTLREAAPVGGGERRERRITEFGDDELLLVFSDDCWVEVKSLDGENLYSDLNRAGQTLVLTGRGPFRVLLGYAPGVRLDFNGDPVDLSRYSRNNVASLVLGQ